MKKVLKIYVLIVFFFAGTLIGTALVIKYESQNFKPWSWKSDPIILNCYGEDLNIDYIERSTKYWSNLNHDVAFIEQNPSSKICSKRFIDGFIILKKRNNDPSTLAYTERKILLGEIRAATIYFSPGSFKLENLIEHELGHAFGYTHIEEVGHIMHPTYEKMGNKFWIP